jgi:chaperonin GroES
MSRSSATYDGGAIGKRIPLGPDETARMLHDLMLIERPQPISSTEGGIIIPDTAQFRSCHGKVIALGLGRILDGAREEIDVKLGDVIMYDGSSGAGVAVDPIEWRGGDGLVIVSNRDVLFIVADDEADPELQHWDACKHRYEPGGERYRQADDQGYWPVGKHLPQWLRDEIEQAGGAAGSRGDRGNAEYWK